MMFFFFDSAVLAAAYAAAFCMRVSFTAPIFGWGSACISFVFAYALQMLLLTLFGLNHSWRWRITARDVPKYAAAFSIAAILLLAMRFVMPQMDLSWVRPPYSVTLIDAVFAFVGITAFRLLRQIHKSAIPVDAMKGQVTVPPYFKNKIVMVTGAGGSIGSEIVRQVARAGAKRVLMVERGENALYNIDYEMRGMNCMPLMVDASDTGKMKAILDSEHPDVILHAAAYKHVPMVEMNPDEGYRNNTLMTANLVKLAKDAGVRRFVFISTDKAVNPKSVMGKTKREAEKFVLAAGYKVVRFGNVFGSSGSVVELWRRQIANGGPVTVTDRRMKRYFMSVEEAVSLVLSAADLEGGKVYTLDMGKSHDILKLAEDMIREAGWRPYKDIAIEFTGIRPGEKLEEELELERGELIPNTKIWVSDGGHS